MPRPLLATGGGSGCWGGGQHSQGTYLATSLKVFFLVMPVPLAVLPFQGSGYREAKGGWEWRER